MTLTVVTPPAGAALSLAAAKEYLRIGHDGEDALVSTLISAAEARLEIVGGIALVSRTVRRSWSAWPVGLTRGGVCLAPSPATALVSVELKDADGVGDLVTGRFQLMDGRLSLRPFTPLPGMPPGGRAEVTFVAGYGAATDVPDDLVQALKRLVHVAYRRGEEGDLPQDVAAAVGAHTQVRL
ncbi:MAG: hypothetical protein R3C13_08355 [Hyphomonas sp.]|uniref:head-tail connector protein n=1 Tax=Hyphomonas sp. TaxID=87 RepID=UPI0035286E90